MKIVEPRLQLVEVVFAECRIDFPVRCNSREYAEVHDPFKRGIDLGPVSGFASAGLVRGTARPQHTLGFGDGRGGEDHRHAVVEGGWLLADHGPALVRQAFRFEPSLHRA